VAAILVIAVVYLVLVLGFFVPGNYFWSTSTSPYGAHAPQYEVLIFSVSPLINVMHTAVGARRRPQMVASWVFALAMFSWFAGMTAYGVLVVAVGTGDRPNLNWADVVLHAGPPWWQRAWRRGWAGAAAESARPPAPLRPSVG
jgi:hypothetical protein